MEKDTRYTNSIQDYLETILELEENQCRVRITDIAARLKLTKASVSQAVKDMVRLGLVKQERYGPVTLTKHGKNEARKIQRRHQAIYNFLVFILGVDPVIAETDACLIEHGVSGQTLSKLQEFLADQSIDRDW